jgi:hypothetical protein
MPSPVVEGTGVAMLVLHGGAKCGGAHNGRQEMATGPRVTKETVEQMAQMVGINLSPTEIEQLAPQLDKLLTDLAQIPDADLQDVEPPLFFEAGEP